MLGLALGSVVIVGIVGLSLFRAKKPASVEVERPRVIRELDSMRQRLSEGLVLLGAERAGGPILPETAPAGQETSIHWEWRRSWPAGTLPAEDFYEFAKVVLDGWPGPYRESGGGGGGSRFERHFGDGRTFACVLMTAFDKDAVTHLHVQEMAVVPTDEIDSPSDAGKGAAQAKLDGFRRLFTAELASRCAPYPMSDRRRGGSPIPRTFDGPGSSVTGPWRRESSWRWRVPGEALAADGLRALAESIHRQSGGGGSVPAGDPSSFLLSFRDGPHHGFVNILAVPGAEREDGRLPGATLYYQQLLVSQKPGAGELPPPTGEARPIDLDALARVPGAMERKRRENAQLDGDGRMLRSLRESDRESIGTWKIEYNLSPREPLADEDVLAFADRHGMTWEAKSSTSPRNGRVTHWLRFFKVMEFSEPEIVRITGEVRAFAERHAARYVGWNFRSEEIRRRVPEADR